MADESQTARRKLKPKRVVEVRPSRRTVTLPARMDRDDLNRQVEAAFEEFKAHKVKAKGKRAKPFPRTPLQKRMQSGDL
jgi:hypothetical protein